MWNVLAYVYIDESFPHVPSEEEAISPPHPDNSHQKQPLNGAKKQRIISFPSGRNKKTSAWRTISANTCLAASPWMLMAPPTHDIYCQNSAVTSYLSGLEGCVRGSVVCAGGKLRAVTLARCSACSVGRGAAVRRSWGLFRWSCVLRCMRGFGEYSGGYEEIGVLVKYLMDKISKCVKTSV